MLRRLACGRCLCWRRCAPEEFVDVGDEMGGFIVADVDGFDFVAGALLAIVVCVVATLFPGQCGSPFGRGVWRYAPVLGLRPVFGATRRY